MASSPSSLRLRHLLVALSVVLSPGWVGVSHSQPVLGFVEDFPGVSTSSWGGGSILGNPGTDGLGGASDGFLDVYTLAEANLGTVSFGTEYAGDWSAAGITVVRCWLNNLGDTPLSIHMSLGNGVYTYQQDAGLSPPFGTWAEYVVDLNGADFTKIRGGAGGTFGAVMQTVDRFHFRHDLAPYIGTPDPMQGHFGLDHIVLTNSSTAVPAGLAARPVLLEPPYPNPARGRVTFQLRQPEARPVQLSIFDAAGRRVREVMLGAGNSAPQLWLWDGNDDRGNPAPAGVYRVLARGDNGGMSRTVTLLR